MTWILIFWICSAVCGEGNILYNPGDVQKRQVILTYTSQGDAVAEKTRIEQGISIWTNSDKKILCSDIKLYKAEEVSK